MIRTEMGLGVVLLALACTPGAGEPAEPIWGKQACAHCSMLVTDKPPSAQLTLADGSREFFDDVGCMAAWVDREGLTPRAWWVRSGDSWVPAEKARFAPGAVTPMDFGFIAAEDGVAWSDVQAAVRGRTHSRGGEP